MIPHPRDTRYKGLAWADLAWPDIENAAKNNYLAVLPLGSIEQHGPMLPVGCDAFLAASWSLEGVCRAREQFNVNALVLPPLPYGIAIYHTEFPGTVNLDLEVYVRLLKNIFREVARAGFRKIVCLSGHGGNQAPADLAMKDFNRELREKNIDLKLYQATGANCFTRNAEICDRIDKQGQYNFHASATETSYYLYMKPDLVRGKGLKKPELKCQSLPLHSNWMTKEITEAGSSGDPSNADSEWGKEIYEYFTRTFAEFLKKVAGD